MATRVVTDSASCLPVEDLSRLGIAVVDLHLSDGDVMRDESDIGPQDLTRLLDLSRGAPGTSQPSPEEFLHAFRTAAAGGHDVLAVLISAKMSGTMRSAEVAAELLRTEDPGVRIELVDSRSNSMQEGFAVLAAAEEAARGGSLEQCAEAARASILRSRFLFVPRTLEYLRRGGRISGAAALAGSVLRIAPVLTAQNGSTGVAGVARSHSRALTFMADRMRADVKRCGVRRAVVQGIVELDEARRFAEEMIEPILGTPVPVIPIGAIVSVHVGPAIGVAYETVEPLG